MPYQHPIIGLKNITTHDVKISRTVKIYASYTGKTQCHHCGSQKYRIKSSFTRVLKHTRTGTLLTEIHLKSHKYFCHRCHRYFNLRVPHILPRMRSTENFREEIFEKHHGGLTQSYISKTHQIGQATVERWYQSFLEKRIKELSGRSVPTVLGIDEHFFTKKKGYATTFCDLKNKKIFDVRLGRSKDALRGYLERLEGKEKVKYVVIDLSSTYRSIVKEYFPNAQIISDRFHVVRLVNVYFLKAWKELDPEGRNSRGLLSLMRRHEHKLKPEQKVKLNQYLNNHPALHEIYKFKQKLCQVLSQKGLSKKVLRGYLAQLLEMMEELKSCPLKPLKTLGESLWSWREEIGRMLKHRKSNGVTEGFHNKMEMISRRAYGFRSFKNYRTRVLAHCGWDGVIAIRNIRN